MSQVIVRAHELAPGDQIGNYVIQSVVGQGGWGTVYLAEHPAIGRRVAVKLLRADLCRTEEALSRFFNEARAANAIRSEHIVDVLDFGQLPTYSQGGSKSVGQPYFIMEWLEGRPLSRALADGAMDLPRALHLVRQVARALAAAHRVGIIHRDLKPDNVFLQEREADREFVKILDFGIAKLTNTDGIAHRTNTGTALGTPYYMSPEQCEGARAIDHRTDIYSLGIILYEMVTGLRPFRAEGIGALLVQQMQQAPQPPRELAPHVPAPLESLILQMLEKQPDHRPQSMEQVLDAISVYTGSHEVRLPVEAGSAPLRLPGVAPAPASSKPAKPPTAPGAVLAPKPVRSETIDVLPTTPAPVVVAPSPPPLLPADLAVKRQSRTWLLIGGGFAGVALVIGAVAMLSGGKGEPAAPPEPAQAAAPSAPAPGSDEPAAEAKPAAREVQLSFTTRPAGAVVRELKADGTKPVVGQTPVALKVGRDSGQRAFQFELPGYRPEVRVVGTGEDREIEPIELQKSNERAPRVIKVPAAPKPSASLPPRELMTPKFDDERPKPPTPGPPPKPREPPKKPKLDEDPSFL